MTSRCTRVAMILLCGVGPAAAQSTQPGFVKPPDPHAAIVRLLRSTDAREQAWGAWYVGRDRLMQFQPLLEHVVAQNVAGGSLNQRAAAAVALDALIQFGARVSVGLIEAVYEAAPPQAIILAGHHDSAREPEVREFLITVLRTGKAEAWFSAANLLRGGEARDRAAALLQGLQLRVTVYIVSSGGAGGGSGSGVGVGCSGGGLAPGLPPWAHYSLTTFSHPGVVVVATGPVSMYYRRTVSRAGETPAGSVSTIGGPSGRHRLQYVADLAGMSEQDLPVNGDESHSVAWQGEGLPDAEIARIRADVEKRFAQLVRSLAGHGLLSESEAAAQRPSIEMIVRDFRKD